MCRLNFIVFQFQQKDTKVQFFLISDKEKNTVFALPQKTEYLLPKQCRAVMRK